MKTAMKHPDEPLSLVEAFTEAIITAKRRHHPKLTVLDEKKIDCFAYLWKTDSTECPDAVKCAVAVECKEAWQDATDLMHPLRKVPAPQTRIAPPPQPTAPPVAAPATPPRRHKAKRVSNRRPVDEALDRFLLALGNPPVLPRGWTQNDLEQEHLQRGRMLISQPNGYTSVYIDKVMRLRFETNAAGRARVEIVSDLVLPVRKTIGGIERIPGGSQKKSKPCIYRVTFYFHEKGVEASLDALAAAVLRVFHLEAPRG